MPSFFSYLTEICPFQYLKMSPFKDDRSVCYAYRYPLPLRHVKYPQGRVTEHLVQSKMVQQQPPPQGGSRKISFNVSDQYDIQDVIGEGAYGVVW